MAITEKLEGYPANAISIALVLIQLLFKAYELAYVLTPTVATENKDTLM